MEPISADYMALRNAELSNQVQTAVMKKTMDAALEQSEQLLRNSEQQRHSLKI